MIKQWPFKELGAAYSDNNCIFNGKKYSFHEGAWSSQSVVSLAQQQTADVFGFKWKQEDTFNSAVSLEHMRHWLEEKYGDMEKLFSTLPKNPIVLDAGCGAAMSALELFRPIFNKIRYVGVDISEAVHVAAKRISQAGFSAVLIREDICQLPFSPNSVDCIFSEGVLHHTDCTKTALKALVPLLKKNGIIMFYVYRKKAVLREFSDDYIREKIQNMPAQEAWEELKSLTQLGITLGQLNVDIKIEQAVSLLGIDAGSMPLQRFFYWNICKMFYRPELSFDEMHHINFDWFAPKNAHRHSSEEVKAWCTELQLSIQRLQVEDAGITVIARKQ